MRHSFVILAILVSSCTPEGLSSKRTKAEQTDRPASAAAPKSPTINRVVFVSTRGDRPLGALYVANIDGTDVRPLSRKLTAKFPSCTEVSCSPIGDRVAFQSNGEIYVASVDGTNAVRLTHHPGPAGRPSWSPDGLHIAFQSRQTGREQIFVIDADGKNLRQITKTPSNYDAAWSPDGSKIAFASLRTGDFEIFVIDVDGKNCHRLTHARGRDTSPDWAPHGGQIVFSSQRDGNQEVYIMGADGKGQRNLTKHPASDSWPSWSPDGKFIAFVTDRDGNDEIYVTTIDGRRSTNCSKHGASDALPDWLLR